MIGKEGDLEAVNRVYKDFVRKMSNTMCKSFLNNRTKLEIGLRGKGVDAELPFHTDLKGYAAKKSTNL